MRLSPTHFPQIITLSIHPAITAIHRLIYLFKTKVLAFYNLSLLTTMILLRNLFWNKVGSKIMTFDSHVKQPAENTENLHILYFYKCSTPKKCKSLPHTYNFDLSVFKY